MKNNITILIPSAGINFDNALAPCIKSLITNTNLQNVKVLLVMNGMKNREKFDNFINPIIQQNSSVSYIWENNAIGYVGAINLGLETVMAQKEKPEFVVFLNDDCVLHSRQWLELLEQPFEKDPLMSIVGAKSLPCPITGVNFPLGFCVMVKTEIFEKVGMLDTSLKIGYGDDTILCIEAIKKGYHVYSYVNGWDKKLKKSVGSFPISHIGENTMHSNELFSLEDWNKQTSDNRQLLARKYWQRIHVVMPVYKRYNKLEKALESLHQQYYTNILVHVVSDGSDEKIRKIIEKKKFEWGRVPYSPEIEYYFSDFEGCVGGLPRKTVLDSLENSEKEWCVFCDSDNEISPDYILKLWQATFLQDVGGAWCQIHHNELEKNIPELGFQDKPVWTQVDSLNFMVRLDIAKRHADKWIQLKDKPVTHDADFAIACFNEKPWVSLIPEVLGIHGQEMSVLVLTVCKDEEQLIPFFLRHYETIADKIIVYDGGSTDKSLELLKTHSKVEIVSVPNEKMNNLELMQIRNEAYKEYREDFDWVIVCDLDEFLWHKNLKEKLEEFRKARITIPTITGYQMISTTFPDNQTGQLYDCIREGFTDTEHLNKSMIFNPKCVDIRYEMGAHKANPTGTVVYSQEPLYLLHFKYIGYTEFIERNKRMAARVSEEDKKHNWAFHYALDAKMTPEEFQQLKNKAKPVFDDYSTTNPLANRQDLKAQNTSIFSEIVEINSYRVSKQDFVGKNIIDIGANIGLFSLLANEYGAEKIVAVEPQPATIEILKKNTAGKGIIIIEKAIGKFGEFAEIVMRPEFCQTDGRIYTKAAESGIETIGVDELVSLVDDGKPILLKLDCEGAEYDALYGASLTSLSKIQTICIEMHEDIFRWEGKRGLIDKLRRYLSSIGFKETFMDNYVEDKVRLLRYDREKNIENDITVVVSVFNRPELLQSQIEAIKKQTLQPKEIIVWQTKSKHWEDEKWVETEFEIPEGVTLITTENDLNLSARFAATLFAKTSYVCLLDDDVFPAEGYLEEALKISKQENAVISAYGMLYDKELNDSVAQRFGDHGAYTNEHVEVDVGGHSWLGKKEWFFTFFKEESLSPTEGDDLHFAYTLKKYTDAKIFVFAVAETNLKIWANTNPSAGLGFRALHTRKWDDIKIWSDYAKIGWRPEDIDYLGKNLKDFQIRRQEILNRYRDEKEWCILKNQKIEKVDKKLEVTVGIPTKNRYFSTLPLTLLSVAMQTYPIKKIIIVDDSDVQKDGKMLDLRGDPMYQYFFSLISKKGIQWEVVYGLKKGQHHSHQIILDKAQTETIWRLDDDESPESNVLEELVKQMKDGVGAVGGLILDPLNFQQTPPNYFNNNKLAEINSRENTQWVMQPKGKVIEVEHLYSSFLYRKVDDIKNCLELSNVAHREESLFSYEYVRKGWKVLVVTNCVTWHFRNPSGGIRTYSDPNLWKHDDEIFKRKLANWAIKPEGKICQIDAGIGDSILFLEILPELLKKYPKIIIGTYYPTLFKNFPVQCLHPFQTKDILGEKLADEQNIYKKLWAESDKGRKLHILDAYRELFLEDEK